MTAPSVRAVRWGTTKVHRITPLSSCYFTAFCNGAGILRADEINEFLVDLAQVAPSELCRRCFSQGGDSR